MACGNYDEVSITTGLMSGGSMDGVGPRFRLSLFLYHPRSRFADAIRADVAAGRAIDYGAITVAGPADPNTNPFLDDPATQETGDPDQPESSSSGANRASSSSAAPPRCGRSPYCSRATDCANPGCRCVADGAINWWSSSCKAVLADSVGRGLREDDNNRISDAGIVSNSSAGMIGGDTLSDMPCPCNCTYVSKGCCGSGSGVVHEEPGKFLGGLRAPNEALRCDTTTGGWRPKVDNGMD
ncbi:MAG: hypothetical protein LQ348_004414 [Seirophora lacunosa]|nr:MAG: hypothetical protein LQ348_004414 [Seirophora lacunosa]